MPDNKPLKSFPISIGSLENSYKTVFVDKDPTEIEVKIGKVRIRDLEVVDFLAGDIEVSSATMNDCTINDDLTVGDNIFLTSDSALIAFGVDGQDMFLQSNDNGFQIQTQASETNTVNNSITLQTKSSGTTAIGFGGAINMQLQNASGLTSDGVKIGAQYTNASGGSESVSLVVSNESSGTLTERMVLTHQGNLSVGGTITDGSGNVLGSGGGGGAIDISGTPSTNQYARWTDADTLEGRSTSDVLSDIGAQASGNYITGTGSLSAQDLTDIGNLSGTNTGDQATGISDGNILECNANVADNDFLKIDGTKVEGRTASEVLSDIGVYDIQRVGYNSTTASASFLPLNGYIIERTSTTSNNEFIAFVAPYNGTLEKIMWRSEIAQSGTFRNLLYESSDGTEVPGAGHGRWDVAVDVADDTTVEFDFTTGATSGTNVLTKGRIYAISIDPISAPYDVNATVVFKWDVTT